MCPLYVAGLIGPGDRKSVSPMAERVAPGDYDRLHHFVSDGVWDEAPLERELALQADKLVGGAGAFLVIDDTTLPKKGAHSVGVAPQYASALGKTANCQTLVSLTLARVEVPVMVGLRLFLPETWTGDEARLERAGVPAQYRSARAKSEIALAELDRLIAAGVRFGTVLADAGYGMGAEFRQALSARGLAWAVGIPRHQKVYPRDVELVFPVAPRGRPRKRHVPNVLSLSAQDMLTQAKWRMLAWRKGTKGPLKARFAAVRVRVADGQPQRIGDKGMQHMPGDEVWLVGERRASGEQKYYLANLPAEAGLKTLAATIKARWVCEQAEHAFTGVAARIAIGARMRDDAPESLEAGPSRRIGKVRPTGCDDHDGGGVRLRAGLDPPARVLAPDDANSGVEDGLEIKSRGVEFKILNKLRPRGVTSIGRRHGQARQPGMRTVGVQMQPIVVTSPRRTNLIGLVEDYGSQLLHLQARRCSKASRTRAYNDRVGVFHRALCSPVGRPFTARLRRLGFAGKPAP